MRKRKLSKAEELFLRENAEKLSLEQLAEHLDMKPEAVKALLDAMPKPKRARPKDFYQRHKDTIAVTAAESHKDDVRVLPPVKRRRNVPIHRPYDD